MRISEFRRVLIELANALETIGAGSRSAALLELAEGLAPFGRRDVSEMECASTQPKIEAEGLTVGDAFNTIRAFQGFVTRIAKPSVQTALNLAGTIVNDRQEMTIRSFIDSLHAAFSPDRPHAANDASLCDAYVDALTEAKHDDKKFPRLFEALSSDERLSKDDVVEIASKFAFKMAKSTSKKIALERIWKMHNASETFAAKSRATKGKSAA